MIDLHVHSTFSDGSFTPEELIGEAARIGLSAIALTDHDTTDGVPRFTAAAVSTSIRAIAGVEISADVKSGTMHMLGYMIDPDNQTLIERLKWLREGREVRNAEILEKLNKLGFGLTWEEVAAFAGEDVVGRPHFAQALLARDLVKDKNEAFDKYLGKGKPAYADRRRMTPENSIQLIREAGGVPVLAHPVHAEPFRRSAEKAGRRTTRFRAGWNRSLLLRAHAADDEPVFESRRRIGPGRNRRLRLPRRDESGHQAWIRLWLTASAG